jgi:uncharacterized RDD family membrane protein YckC
MNWHYVEGAEARGPVTDEQLEYLARVGTIGPDTLVWREGMADWLPYSQVLGPPVLEASPAAPPGAAPPGYVFCGECGRPFPPEEMIPLGGQYICAACKPFFLQKLREGVFTPQAMRYAGFWIRFCARLLDGLIILAAMFAIELATRVILGGHPARLLFATNQSISIILGCSFETFFIGKFAATPGKMALKLQVVNSDGSKVSYAKAVGRYFAAQFISGCFTLFIGYMMAGWDPEKRALHDRICDTRVIQI